MPDPTPPVLSVDPIGEFALPLVRCAQLLATCEEVQALFDVETAAAAFDKIDFPLRDVETYGEPLPGIIIQGMDQKAGYNGDEGGRLMVSLFEAINPDFDASETQPLDFKNDLLEWINRIGTIWTEMKSYSKRPLPAFDGERFNAIRWKVECYPTHDYRELDADSGAKWYRFAAFSVEWTT